MNRIHRNLRLYWGIWCVLGMTAVVRGDEAAEAKLQQLAEASRSRAEGIEVRTSVAGVRTKAKLHANPLMKYTDVPRDIEMATLWVWQDEGCPVALAKVEAYKRKEGTRWLYCFTSTSTGRVDARWPEGRRFQSREPGIQWTALDGLVPQETAAGRRRQVKTLFRRFSVTTRDEVLKTSDRLRPLARPLHEYTSPRQGVLQGFLCGFAANGTNPDMIVALEAIGPPPGKDGPKSWRYGVIGMTASGASVKLDDGEVFNWPYARSTGDRDTWTHFWEKVPRK